MSYKKIYLLSLIIISELGIINIAKAADEPIELIVKRSNVKKDLHKTDKLNNKEAAYLFNNSSFENTDNKNYANNANYTKEVPLNKFIEESNKNNPTPTSITNIAINAKVEPAKISFLNQDVIDIDNTNLNNQYTKNKASLWNRIRLGFTMPELENEQSREKTTWYAERADYFARINERANKYLYYIVDELEKRKMPLELALLPIIESAFNPTANSSVKAAGIWQFMPKTGKYFNLDQNLFVDERRDVLSSTKAALDYLQKLYGMFGDWHLALAAYNWGEGSVARAIARNKAEGLPTAYTDLNMPTETKYYVPKLQAVKNIINDPEKYGIKLVDIPNHPYFVTITTSKDIDVELAAKFAEMSIYEFKSINPSFSKKVIIGATKPQILLPWEKAEKFQNNLKNYKSPLSTVTAIKLERKEKVDALASRFGISAESIRSINNIGKGFRFRAGSTVLLPKSSDLQADISESVAENAHISTEKDTPEFKKVFIYVQKKDTLNKIADRYDVTVSQLISWNNIGKRLIRGQSLALVVPYNKTIYSKPAPIEEETPVIKHVKINRKHSGVHLTNMNNKYVEKPIIKTVHKNKHENTIIGTKNIKIVHKNVRIIKVADKRQQIHRN